MSGLAYLNGRLTPQSEAAISPADHGFLYGDGLFETIRIYNGQPFLLKEHLERLAAGCAKLVLAVSLTPGQMAAAIHTTIEANRVKEGYLRLTVSRGPGTGWDPRACPAPTIYISVQAGIPYQPDTYERGFKVIISGWRRNHFTPLSQIKSLNFLENVLARSQAKEAGADEAIMLNLAGQVAEGSMSNLFLRLEGKLVTPPVTSGILPGITRQEVLRLAGELGMEAKEEELLPESLELAEEVFLTSSLGEVMPVADLAGRAVSNGRPGHLSRSMLRAYRESVQSAVGAFWY